MDGFKYDKKDICPFVNRSILILVRYKTEHVQEQRNWNSEQATRDEFNIDAIGGHPFFRIKSYNYCLSIRTTYEADLMNSQPILKLKH